MSYMPRLTPFYRLKKTTVGSNEGLDNVDQRWIGHVRAQENRTPAPQLGYTIEKTLSMKKVAKSGNKQKQKETNAEIERLERELSARHEKELAELMNTTCPSSTVGQAPLEQPEVDTDELDTGFYKQLTIFEQSQGRKQNLVNASSIQIQARQEEAIRRMQEAVQQDQQDAEKSLRVTEMTAIQKILDERELDIVDIAPDGDCLYNALAHQLSRVKGFEQVTGKDMRRRAAKYIREHKDDFIPFLVNESDDPLDEFEFEKYCHGVENESKDGGVWGGEPELNAISQSLERSIELIQPTGPPVIFGEQYNKTKPLIIVYHRHAYQLGAHYNSTAVRKVS
ncbi:OTU-like cysteine protease [Cooperia oncophora]